MRCLLEAAEHIEGASQPLSFIDYSEIVDQTCLNSTRGMIYPSTAEPGIDSNTAWKSALHRPPEINCTWESVIQCPPGLDSTVWEPIFGTTEVGSTTWEPIFISPDVGDAIWEPIFATSKDVDMG